MNTKQLNRIFTRAVYSMVIVAMVVSVTGNVYAQEGSLLNPRIEAFAWFDRIQLFDWPSGVTVEVSISNPDLGARGVDVDPQGFAEFYPEVDLQLGSIITAIYGDTTKVLEISPLSATVDPTTGVVSGVAMFDHTFHMKTDADHFVNPIEEDIVSDSAGNWSANFSAFAPLTWFTRGEMWEGDDDGDVTYAIWHVQQQVIEVWLAQNEIRAFGWPRDTELTFNVDGVDIGTAFTEPVNWMEGTWAVFNAGELQLEPGMEVSVTDGIAMPKSTTVQDLMITNIDIDNDIVEGYAPQYADLELGSWKDSPVIRFFNNGEDPNWVIDYKIPSINNVTVDLDPGDELRLFMRDAEKDSTVWQGFAPWPPSTFVVNTTDDYDDGDCTEAHCSLREAINISNSRQVADTIVFNIPGEAPFTIQTQSPLPNIDDSVMIDGTTQPGYIGSPIIELDGTFAGEWVTGLVIGASDSTVKGLVINRYSGDGLVIYGSGNVIQSNYIGTDATGTSVIGSENGPAFGTYAVEVMPGTCPTYEPGTERDGFVSETEDPLSPWSGTSVTFMGTDEDKCGVPETFEDVPLIYRYKLTFEEPTDLASIAVSGAAFNGGILRVLDSDMEPLGTTYTFGGNSFQTNYVRLFDVIGQTFYVEEYDYSSDWRYRENIVINGSLPLGNHGNGVLIAGGATNNTVIENLISGNMGNGVGIFNPDTTGNVVQENYIGTNIMGTQALGNGAPGVGIGEQAYNNFIIGNLISGNRSDGIAIFNPETNGNTLQGNNIGTDASGMAALPNTGVGVWIGDGASNTSIGGTDASVRNVISGNKWGGVSINDLGTTGTHVTGNYIGTNKNGDVALPNGGDGVYISGSENVIGGSEPGAGNVISGNTSNGVSMTSGATGNLIQNNFIGTDVSGTTPLHSASGPEFGHYDLDVLPETCPTYEAGTGRDAFVSESNDLLAPWDGTSVMFMGTDEDKCGVPDTFEDAPLIYRYKLTFAEPTELTSIAVSGAAFNGGALRVLDENMDVLGTAYNFGSNSFQTNYVRLNGVVGQVFFVEEYDYSSDWRYRQSIVINGQLPVGNLASGVNFNNGASNNLVLDNLISGNRSDAVSLYYTGTNGNVLQGNYIGTDVSGTAAVPNTSAAIWIGEGASNNMIGGIEEGQGNIVSGNTGDAISINNAETTGTVIQGNFIGTDVTGSVTLPNNSNGIVLVTGTHDNLIGGTEPGAGNVISGNFGDGVLLVDGGTSNNTVQNNFIGTDVTGTIALGNWNRGVYLGGGAADNLFSGNVISGNGAAGIRLIDSGTTGNRIQSNYIGTDITGTSPLGNGYIGIRITDDAADNVIGGIEPGAGNIIAFNADAGIKMNGEGVFGNALLTNSVFSNAGLGIDLNEDDVTPNDVLDEDTGPNELQNFPVITVVARMGSGVMIQGLLPSTPLTMFRVEFFSNETCDPSGFGEGEIFLGATSAKTNPAGLAHFSITLPISLPQDAFVTATATDPAGNTSEFSRCFTPAPGWNQINDSGFDNPQNVVVSALEIFNGKLYAGSGNWDTGGEIWRLGQNDPWIQVNESGFGSGSSNPVVTDMVAFQGKLYAGTGLNSDNPGQIWRSPNGLNWQPVTTDGFGDVENNGVTSFVVFKSMLYAGTSNVNGSAQIWRSSTGDDDSWKQVAPDGSGMVGTVTGFGVYGGALYAAIEPPNATGAPIQVWRSTNGSNWVTITDDGFGDERNESTGGFAQFGGYLYLGTQNGETGAQLWRTKDGLHWEQVVGDGFGAQNNIKIESLLVYGDPGYLYAATKNIEMGMQVWRSADGTNWEQVTANGFGDGGNFATLWNNASAEYQGNLLFGTWNYGEGGEVWMFSP